MTSVKKSEQPVDVKEDSWNFAVNVNPLTRDIRNIYADEWKPCENLESFNALSNTLTWYYDIGKINIDHKPIIDAQRSSDETSVLTQRIQRTYIDAITLSHTLGSTQFSLTLHQHSYRSANTLI